VTIGLIVENEISFQAGLLSQSERDRILSVGAQLIGNGARKNLKRIDLAGIIDLLFKDKKTEVGVLKLVIPKSIGEIVFIDFPLTGDAMPRLEEAFKSALHNLG
jgi:3-dehydroquinate synthetase